MHSETGDVTACVNEGHPARTTWAYVYSELRRRAARLVARERTPDLTGIVHEAWIKLRRHPPKGGWQSRAHYYGSASRAIRQALVDRARKARALKRGDGAARAITPDDGCEAPTLTRVLMLDEALRRLEQVDSRQARVAEMKLFGDLPMALIAEQIDVTPRTAQRDWLEASERLRGWLGSP